MDEGSIEEIKIVLRPFIPDLDQACVYSTWRNSAFYGVPRRTAESKSLAEKTRIAFFKGMTRDIREILKSATVRIACFEDDPGMILGYSVAIGSHLNWIYVKVEYRLKGIGRMLMPKDILTVTNHLTKIGEVIVDKKKLKVKGENTKWN